MEESKIGPVGLCEVCREVERKYKCPKCSTFSCSLECCRKHKVDRNCSGRREQSSYQGLKQLDDSDLRRDYHFLENVLSRKDSAKRTLSQSLGGLREDGSQRRQGVGRGGARRNSNKKARTIVSIDGFGAKKLEQNLDMHKPSVRRLVKACEERQVSLMVMSPGMTRRETNTSRFVQKKDKVYWRLHIVFVASKGGASEPSHLLQPDLECSNEGALTAKGGLVGITLEEIDEDDKIKDILSPFIGTAVGEREAKSNEAQRHALRYLRSHRDDAVCLLQRIPSSAICPVFTSVSETASLREAVSGQTVLEYPVLFVGTGADTEGLRRHIEEVDGEGVMPIERGEVNAEGEGEEEEEKAAEEEDEDHEGFMAELEEMGTRDIKDLHAIIREESEL